MGGKSTTISNSEQRVLSLQLQQSSRGLTIPVVYGQTRISGNLIWQGDFTALEHVTTETSGKGGGGVTQKTTTYTYEAAVAMALCEGATSSVVSVWKDKKRYHGTDGLRDMRMSFMGGTSTQRTWPHLTSRHPSEAINYSDTAYVYSPNYELGSGASIPNHMFEVAGLKRISNAIPDANPADVIYDLLTNSRYGCGISEINKASIDKYRDYCAATGIMISPSFGEQKPAHESVEYVLGQTNSALVYSDGEIHVVPYADSAVSSREASYTPNLAPVFDLTDNDVIASGDDPIKVNRKTNADAFNCVRVEYLDRANDYNIAVAEAKDQAAIEKYGLRQADPIQYHSICRSDVAAQVAQLLLQRHLYVRNEFEFKLGWKHCALEPMDLVTLTDSGLGLDKHPVRIIEIEESADGLLSVIAEDFPLGVASATKYPTQENAGYAADYNVNPGDAHAPAFIEAPLSATDGSPEVWIATSGGKEWGGATVHVSLDGNTYSQVGIINAKARYGVLTAPLPTGAVYDKINKVQVALTGGGTLPAVSGSESSDFLTMSAVGDEYLSYKQSDLTGVASYDLADLTRGLAGSVPQAHESGTRFVRLDDALFKYPYDKNLVGKRVFVKLTSFNVYGSATQSLADVPAYEYTIKGAPVGVPANLKLTSNWSFGRDASISWDIVTGAAAYDVEVYSSASATPIRRAYGVTANSYTYSVQDMKQDGGQTRDVIFKVRSVTRAGKGSGWASVTARNPQLRPLTGIKIETGLLQAFFTCDTPGEDDFKGIQIWASTDAACPTVPANLIYDGGDTFVTISKVGGLPLESGVTYYLRAGGYDSFDKMSMNVSAAVAFSVFGINAVAVELSESSLNAELRRRIDLIDGTGNGSVNARLTAEANATAAAIKKTADEAAAALTAKAAEMGTAVLNVEKVNSQQAQQLSTLTAAQGNLASGIEAEKKARIEGDKAEAAARETLASKIDVTAASLSDLKTTQATKDQATATRLSQAESKIAGNAANINNLQSTKADASQVVALARTALSSEWNKSATDAAAKAQTNAAADAKAKADAAQAAAVKAAADAQSAAIAAAGGDATAKANAAKAQAVADAAAADAKVKADAAADAKAKADKALTDAKAYTSAETVKMSANISAIQKTLTDANKAQAEEIKTLSAAVNAGGNLLPNSEYLMPDRRGVPDGYTLTNSSGVMGYHDLVNGVYTYRLRDVSTFGLCDTRDVSGSQTGNKVAYHTCLERISVTPGQIFQFSIYLAGWNLAPNSGNIVYLDFRGVDDKAVSVGRTRRGSFTYGSSSVVGNGYGRNPVADGFTSLDKYQRFYVNERIPDGVAYINIGVALRSTPAQTGAYLFCAKPMLCEVLSLDAPPVAYSTRGVSAQVSELKRVTVNADGTTDALAMMKVDANGRIAAFGLANEVKDGKVMTRAIFNVDQFGIGATGKADQFPFTVDTVKNVVGIDGQIVVNGKAIIDNLVAGSIIGDKIAANSITAAKLAAGSVTAAKLAANSVTAVNIAAGQEIRSPKISGGTLVGGSIEGGSLNIGDGAATIDETGTASFTDAYISGYADIGAGIFRGDLVSHNIQGDNARIYRFKPYDGTRARIVLPAAPRPRLVYLMPMELLIGQGDTSTGGGSQIMTMRPWVNINSSRFITFPNPRTETVPSAAVRYGYSRMYTLPVSEDTNGTVRTSSAWRLYYRVTHPASIVLAPNQQHTIWLGTDTPAVWENHTEFNESARLKFVEEAKQHCVLVSYLDTEDAEYGGFYSSKSWGSVIDPRTLRTSGIQLISTGVYRCQSFIILPDNCWGVSFDYYGDTNGDWAWGIEIKKETPLTVKSYSKSNHVGSWKNFSATFPVGESGVVISLKRQTGWQWFNIRNLKIYTTS